MWPRLCESFGEVYEYCKVENIETDSFFFIPQTEISASWRSHYVACCRKIELVQFEKLNELEFTKYFVLYSKLNSVAFGKMRKFSNNIVYLLVDMLRSASEELYELIEIMQQKSILREKKMIHENFEVTILYYFQPRKSNAACPMIDDDKVHKSDLSLSVCLCKIESCIDVQFLSYSHVAQSVIAMREFIRRHFPDASAPESSSAASISAFKPRLSMPFEAYHLHLDELKKS